MHHVTKLESSQTGFLNMTMSSLTQMTSTVTRSQSNRAPLGCGGTRDSHHGCADDKSAATVWCYHDNMDQNCFQHLVESMPRRIKAGLKAKGGQPGTSKVYLIKWSVSVYYNIIFYLNYTHIYYGFESLIRDIELSFCRYWLSNTMRYSEIQYLYIPSIWCTIQVHSSY